MEKSDAIAALAALAQDNRLDVFRLLVRAGTNGHGGRRRSPSALGLPPNTLSFHFDRLRQAGLVTVRREGRSLIYAAQIRHHERAARLPHRELLHRRARRTAPTVLRAQPARKARKQGARMSMPSNSRASRRGHRRRARSALPPPRISSTRGVPVQALRSRRDRRGACARAGAMSGCSRPGRYNTDTAAQAILRSHGWQGRPADVLPTGGDLSAAYLSRWRRRRSCAA